LSKFIFLCEPSVTAKRISRFDLPTPLFPMSRAFIVRSLNIIWKLQVIFFRHTFF
jgi:hypothetical protein